jgi:phytanoyl-CoA hydroxylase
MKGVIPREKVLAMRKKYFEYVSSSGVLKEGTDPEDGIFCGGVPHKFGEHPSPVLRLRCAIL